MIQRGILLSRAPPLCICHRNREKGNYAVLPSYRLIDVSLKMLYGAIQLQQADCEMFTVSEE